MPSNNNLTELEIKQKKIALILAVVFVFLILLDFIIISQIYSWADWVSMLIFSLLFMVPAYISNASMVFTGGGNPIDGGRNFRDGRRILGDHKTWNGLKGPLFIGIPISFFIFLLFIGLWLPIQELVLDSVAQGQYILYDNVTIFKYYFTGGSIPINFIILIIRIILASYGAAFGDLVGSFLKRRFDIKSGAPFWIVDQLDFALFALLFGSIPSFLFPGLFLLPDIFIVILMIILTPAISIIANTVAYFGGLKSVPW